MNRRIDLGPLAAVPDGGSRGYLEDELGQQTVLVVRRGNSAAAYANRCPHTGAPLNWRPHRFLDAEDRHIQCDLHGALFRIEDGRCLAGPCVGDALQPLPLRIDGGRMELTLPEPGGDDAGQS